MICVIGLRGDGASHIYTPALVLWELSPGWAQARSPSPGWCHIHTPLL